MVRVRVRARVTGSELANYSRDWVGWCVGKSNAVLNVWFSSPGKLMSSSNTC